MYIVRKIYSIIFGLIFAVALFLLPISQIIKSDLSNSSKISSWSSNAGDYQIVINNLSSQILNSLSSSSLTQIVKPSSQEIKSALEQSISLTYFNQIKNQVLTANYNWLEGKTTKPVFQISLLNFKTNLINQIITTPGVKDYCNRLVLYQQTTELNCTISITDSLNSNLTLSSFQTLNQDNLGSFIGISNSSIPYYVSYSNLPNYYQFLMHLPNYLIFLLIGIVLFSILIFGLKFRFIKFLFRSLAFAVIVILIGKFVISPIFNNLSNISAISKNQFADYIIKMISYFSNDLRTNLNKYIYIYVGIFLILAVLYFSKFLKKKHKKQINKEEVSKTQPSQNFISLNERKSQHK